MQTGETFVFDNTKYSIKQIDGQVVYASPFHTNENGEEKIRKGRPKRFSYADVSRALGGNNDGNDVGTRDVGCAGKCHSTPVSPKINIEDDGTSPEIADNWEDLRDASKEDISNLLSTMDDKSTSEDW